MRQFEEELIGLKIQLSKVTDRIIWLTREIKNQGERQVYLYEQLGLRLIEEDEEGGD